MEIVKEKRIGVIVLLAIVVLLLLANCAFGQEMEVLRQKSYSNYFKKEVVRKYPSYGLQFVNGADTISVSMYSDSISNNKFGVRVYAYYSKSTDLSNSRIKIGFNDGSQDYLAAFEVDKVSGYVEYNIPQLVYDKIFISKVKSIQFNNINIVNPVEDSLFFYAFLNKLEN